MEIFTKHCAEIWEDRKDVKAFVLKIPGRNKEEFFFLHFSGITFWGEGHRTIQTFELF